MPLDPSLKAINPPINISDPVCRYPTAEMIAIEGPGSISDIIRRLGLP